jgi:UDP-N-acetylglucosamine 2-epimerase
MPVRKMKQIHIALVLGARPQIIKSSQLIRLATEDEKLKLSVIHTGQHYDYEMTKVFFEEFRLPEPVANLDVGSATHAQQTARIISRLEPALLGERPDLVLVPGDTNSTIAGALTAAKLNIPVAHIESGARSYDMKMPEEVNRRLTDHCSTMLFTATKRCSQNLVREGISKRHIAFVGDTMYDVLLQQLPKAEKTAALEKVNVRPKAYALLTLHRQENVDNQENLKKIVNAIARIPMLDIVFPLHPRTRKQLSNFNMFTTLRSKRHIKLIEPVGYLENICFIKNAALVMTDSGGMQKEAFWLKTPCLTLRKSTEWMETVELGANCLVGSDTELIVKCAAEMAEDSDLRKRMTMMPNPFGDGHASDKIIHAIKSSPLFSG